MAKSIKKATAVEATKRFDATEKNRDARLKRHLKKHPQDAVAQAATKTAAPVRRKPKSKGSTKAVKTQKIVVFMGKDVGFKSVVPRLTGGSDFPYRERGMNSRVYEGKVREHRADLAKLMKETQGRFGKVPVNTEELIKENVKALCYGLGIHYTGKSFAPRRAYKGKR